MFAQVAGLEVGTLTHNIGDCHIYDRHIPLVKKLIEGETKDVSPKLIINNQTKNFYDFKVEDFEIQGYDYNKEMKLGKIPVAI
jgi:thymidylate synthase